MRHMLAEAQEIRAGLLRAAEIARALRPAVHGYSAAETRGGALMVDRVVEALEAEAGI